MQALLLGCDQMHGHNRSGQLLFDGDKSGSRPGSHLEPTEVLQVHSFLAVWLPAAMWNHWRFRGCRSLLQPRQNTMHGESFMFELQGRLLQLPGGWAETLTHYVVQYQHLSHRFVSVYMGKIGSTPEEHSGSDVCQWFWSGGRQLCRKVWWSDSKSTLAFVVIHRARGVKRKHLRDMLYGILRKQSGEIEVRTSVPPALHWKVDGEKQ